ncbi:MAG: hypothetical protein SO164_00270 [Campylobacter sp.]|nr:hypothetical protein [Campylobacter sp.]
MAGCGFVRGCGGCDFFIFFFHFGGAGVVLAPFVRALRLSEI